MKTIAIRNAKEDGAIIYTLSADSENSSGPFLQGLSLAFRLCGYFPQGNPREGIVVLNSDGSEAFNLEVR